MTTGPVGILAQQEGFDWSALVYLLIVIVIPALNAFGKWIRDRFGQAQQKAPPPAGQRPKAIPAIPIAKERPRATSAGPQRPKAVPAIPVPRPKARPAVRPQVPPVAKPVAPAPPQQQPRPMETRRRVRVEDPMAAAKRERLRMAEALVERAATREKEAEPGEILAAEVEPPSASRGLLPERITAIDLRAAVILSEIFRPPLALRRPDESTGPTY